MAHCGMPRIARRLGSVCQDTGRPRSDHADHGVCRTMAQRCSAPAQVVEGVSHQSARKKGLLPAPRRVNRRRHRPLPVSNLSFPYRWIPACPASQFFSLKNWHHPSHPFHYSQNFLLICSDTTDPSNWAPLQLRSSLTLHYQLSVLGSHRKPLQLHSSLPCQDSC